MVRSFILNPAARKGGSVSPILANVYLHYVLDLWFDRVVKPRCKGQVMMIRYADDYICASQYKSDAKRFYRAMPKRLEKYKLSVAQRKRHCKGSVVSHLRLSTDSSFGVWSAIGTRIIMAS